MKNFVPLIIILIIVSTNCSTTEEKTKEDKSDFIFGSLINGASNFYYNYVVSTVKYVTCPFGDKGCEMAANIQIAAEGLKTANIGQEAGAKILEKVIEASSTQAIKEVAEKAGETLLEKAVEKTSTEAIKGVAEKKAQSVVFEWGTRTGLYMCKFIPVLTSANSIRNAVKKFKNNDKLGGALYTAEAIVGWIPGLSYLYLLPSVANTIKEIAEIKSEK